MKKNRSDAQRWRQDKEFRTKGRYSKVNPCQGCGKSAGVKYYSHPLTDTGNWADKAICLCKKCATETQEFTKPEEFEEYKNEKQG